MRFLLVLLFALSPFTGHAEQETAANQPAIDDSKHIKRPVLIEMFLSQACSACPAAAQFLSDIAADPNFVALSWHVNYWDEYRHPYKGSWRDPYAQHMFGERQKMYNMKIRGRPRNFTPQAILNGHLSAVGSKPDQLRQLAAKLHTQPQTSPTIQFRVAHGMLMIDIFDLAAHQKVTLTDFYRHRKTEIRRGPNAGVLFVDANVVTNVQTIAVSSGQRLRFQRAAPGPEMGCAVIVQDGRTGQTQLATYCPPASAPLQ